MNRARTLVAVVAAVLVLVTACNGSTSTTTTGTTAEAGAGATTSTADEGTTTTSNEGTSSTKGTATTRPSGSDDEQAYIDALTGSFAGDSELTSEQAACAAKATVEAIGVEAFQDNGVQPEDLADGSSDFELGFQLDEQQARGVVDGLDDCLDLTELMTQGIAEDDQLTDDQKACLQRELTSEVVKELMVTILLASEDDPTGGFAALGALFEIMARCGVDTGLSG